MHRWVKTASIHPLSIGRQLALVREHLGVAVDDLVQRTRLSHRIIAAIENSDHPALGARIYAVGAISSYARAVGYDANVAIEELLQESQWLWSSEAETADARKQRRSFWGRHGHISQMGI